MIKVYKLSSIITRWIHFRICWGKNFQVLPYIRYHLDLHLPIIFLQLAFSQDFFFSVAYFGDEGMETEIDFLCCSWALVPMEDEEREEGTRTQKVRATKIEAMLDMRASCCLSDVRLEFLVSFVCCLFCIWWHASCFLFCSIVVLVFQQDELSGVVLFLWTRTERK